MPEYTALITAARGNIGTELIPQLLADGNFKLILPTSNASRLRSTLGSNADSPNVVVEEGSIQNPGFILDLLLNHNVSTVFLCVTGTDELFVTCNFLDSMVRAAPRVKQLVYLTGCGDFVSAEGSRHLMAECHAAHVVVKSAIEQKLRAARLPWTTTYLGPTLFFTNDLRSEDAILSHGLFDEPLGQAGVSRVHPADIARAVKNAMLDRERWAGKKIMIGSLKKYSGAEICALWGDAVGKKLTMVEPDDEFETSFGNKAGHGGEGAMWARDLRLMYEYFGSHGFGMSEADYKLQVELLGKEPEDFPTWVKKSAESWK